jgi:hypothetical protein
MHCLLVAVAESQLTAALSTENTAWSSKHDSSTAAAANMTAAAGSTEDAESSGQQQQQQPPSTHHMLLLLAQDTQQNQLAATKAAAAGFDRWAAAADREIRVVGPLMRVVVLGERSLPLEVNSSPKCSQLSQLVIKHVTISNVKQLGPKGPSLWQC